MAQLLYDDVISIIIGYADLDTLLVWRLVSIKCTKVAIDAFKIQEGYQVMLSRQLSGAVEVIDDILNVCLLSGGHTMECEVNYIQDKIIIPSGALSTMYFHPEDIPLGGIDPSRAKVYISLSMIFLLEYCDVVLKPDYVHACRNCVKLFKHVYLITELEKISDLKCSSCRKITKLVCGGCRTKVQSANYRLVVSMMQNYGVDVNMERILGVVRGLCEPNGQLVEFLRYHCAHQSEHQMMFEPSDD